MPSVKKPTSDSCINIALDTISIGKQAFIFVKSKPSAEKTAEDIARTVKDTCLRELSEKVRNVLPHPTKQCERLAKCVEKGIAFHHAGLTADQREIIEDNFREGKIKIITCTPTLAAGVDLPAYRTILKDLRRYSGFGLNWIPVLEYHQMAGRAGRPKFDKVGEAISICRTEAEKDEITERYINGEPEEIYSKLAVEPVLRTYILSLIATGFVRTTQQLLDFFSKTFWAFQFQDMERLEAIILKMIHLLEEYEFIKTTAADDFTPADQLMEEEKLEATLMGKRVAQLYIDPMTAYKFICNVKKATKNKAIPFSYLLMVANTPEIRPWLRVKSSEFDKVEEDLVKYNDHLLENPPSLYDPEYDEFLDAFKTALMLNDWVTEGDEEALLEKYNIRPGELTVKKNNADWLLYSAEELTKLLQFKGVIKDIIKLRLRLKYGAKEELLPLLQVKNIGRVRARRLFQANIKDLAQLKKVSVNTLASIIGKNMAIKVKEQLGQSVDKLKVKENKRKGQISLKDF